MKTGLHPSSFTPYPSPTLLLPSSPTLPYSPTLTLLPLQPYPHSPPQPYPSPPPQCYPYPLPDVTCTPLPNLTPTPSPILPLPPSPRLRYFYFVFSQTDVKVGSQVSAVRQNPFCQSQVGTGGQKNDLKLWDLERPEEPIFRAKNVMIVPVTQRKPVPMHMRLFFHRKKKSILVVFLG